MGPEMLWLLDQAARCMITWKAMENSLPVPSFPESIPSQDARADSVEIEV